MSTRRDTPRPMEVIPTRVTTEVRPDGSVYTYITGPLGWSQELAAPSSRYERIVSVLRDWPEVRNITGLAKALDKELSRHE